MSKKVICYIQAFDCEKTIAATMQSVLDQTYENWLCFVLSNGNKNTSITQNYSFDIIKSMAARDSRFILLNKKRNDIDMYIPMLYHLAGEFPDSYICSLDADDIYEKDFFQRAVSLAETHDLDIVACGTQIILKERAGAEDKALLSKREVKEDWIIRGSEFTTAFPRYKPFFNEMWGKLYHTGLFGKQYNRDYADKHFFQRFLPDTLFTIDNLSRSKAIGILSGTSHRFYQFEQRSATNATLIANAYTANRTRKNVFSVYGTYETIMRFLHSKGTVNKDLYEYMQAVLFGWFGDFYNRTILPTQNEKKISEHVSNLILNPKFDKLMRYEDSGAYHNLKDYQERKLFCQRLRNLLVGQKAIRNRRAWIRNRPCSPGTVRKLDMLIQKLDDTIQELSALQARREK